LLMEYSFGVTELAKVNGDEEVARVPTNDEKPHNTHVQETTADVISPETTAARERAVARGQADRASS
jgi:hypothetical protein